MIVPSQRLLFGVALVVVPFVTIGVAVTTAVPIAGTVLAAFVLLVLVDLAISIGRSQGLSVEVEPLVRLVEDRVGTFPVHVINRAHALRAVRIGFDVPASIHAEEERTIALPSDSDRSVFECECAPEVRGKYQLKGVALEVKSPLGFWDIRSRQELDSELRVYPNLDSDQRQVSAMFLNRGAFGVHAQRQIGKGREFEKVREYITGDSFEDIHWRMTAKRGHPITKVFQIERTQEIYVVIDRSRLTARMHDRRDENDEVREDSILERYIRSALVLGMAAQKQGDLFGLITFSDKVESFVRARNGKAHYSAIRDALYTLQPRNVTPDFNELFTFIRMRLRRRALLVFLTALDDPILAENFAARLPVISRQHLILVNMLQPAGVRPIFSNTAVQSTDDLFAELGGHFMWQTLRELGATLQRTGVRFATLHNERLAAQLVSQYVDIKQRQLL